MGTLINSCKKNDSPPDESLVLGQLARHLCLQSTFLVDVPRGRVEYLASERDTLRCNAIEILLYLLIFLFIYMVRTTSFWPALLITSW